MEHQIQTSPLARKIHTVCSKYDVHLCLLSNPPQDTHLSTVPSPADALRILDSSHVLLESNRSVMIQPLATVSVQQISRASQLPLHGRHRPRATHPSAGGGLASAGATRHRRDLWPVPPRQRTRLARPHRRNRQQTAAAGWAPYLWMQVSEAKSACFTPECLDTSLTEQLGERSRGKAMMEGYDQARDFWRRHNRCKSNRGGFKSSRGARTHHSARPCSLSQPLHIGLIASSKSSQGHALAFRTTAESNGPKPGYVPCFLLQDSKPHEPRSSSSAPSE